MGRLYLPKGVKAVAVDSNDYTKINPEHIPADERFLYTYVFRMNFHLRLCASFKIYENATSK